MLQVRRRGLLRSGPRYVELWNLAAVPTPGRVPPADRTARAGWRVAVLAVQVAEVAGLEVRLRSSTSALAASFYVPLGFSYERPARPGSKPRMVRLVLQAAKD